MKTKGRFTKPIMTWVDERDYANLNQVRHDLDMSLSEVVRRALRVGLPRLRGMEIPGSSGAHAE